MGNDYSNLFKKRSPDNQRDNSRSSAAEGQSRSVDHVTRLPENRRSSPSPSLGRHCREEGVVTDNQRNIATTANTRETTQRPLIEDSPESRTTRDSINFFKGKRKQKETQGESNSPDVPKRSKSERTVHFIKDTFRRRKKEENENITTVILEKFPHPIELRRPQPEDAQQIRSIQRTNWEANYPNEELGITKADIQWWFENETLEQKHTRTQLHYKSAHPFSMRVAKNGHEVMGFWIARKGDEQDPSHALWLLYIHPDYQKLGLGRTLLTNALKELGTEKSVILDVVTYNTNAIDFYQHMGFDFVDRHVIDTDFVLRNGKTLPTTKMILPASRIEMLLAETSITLP